MNRELSPSIVEVTGLFFVFKVRKNFFEKIAEIFAHFFDFCPHEISERDEQQNSHPHLEN